MKLKSGFKTILTLLLAISPFMFSMEAMADGTFTTALCKGYGIFNGPLGKMMAVFAIVALGVGLFMGKITWGLVIAVALGIGAIFGAPTLVNFMTGGSGTICASSTSDSSL